MKLKPLRVNRLTGELQPFRIGDRVKSLAHLGDEYGGFKQRGVVTRIRASRHSWNTDVRITESDFAGDTIGKVIGSISACWVHENFQLNNNNTKGTDT
jgi:hypothetical protein